MSIMRFCIFLLFSVFSMTTTAKESKWIQSDGSSLRFKTELASPVTLEKQQEMNYLKISLDGLKRANTERSPVNLTLVIDRSGSMNGVRILKARQMAMMVVDTLGPQDILSIVVFNNTVEVVVPPTKVTDKTQLKKIIYSQLLAKGGTALYAGVEQGIHEVSSYLNPDQVNRIILLSDGAANIGPSSVEALSELARQASSKGISISTMGLGQGYNENLLTAIALHSDGNHFFIENITNMEDVFAREIGDVMSVVAQDVTVKVTLSDDTKLIRFLGREGVVSGNAITFKVNRLLSGLDKYVLLEILPKKGIHDEQKLLAEVDIRYKNLITNHSDHLKDKVMVRYSHSKREIKQMRNESVVVDYALQKATLESEVAIRLLDEGKMDEAKSKIHQNIEDLKMLKALPQEEKDKVKESVTQYEKQLEMLETKNKNVSRKSLKEQNYNSQMQNGVKEKHKWDK